MADNTKEVKLVITAVNASDKAFKAAAINLKDTKKLLTELSLSGQGTAITLESVQKALAKATIIIDSSRASFRKIITDFATGKTTIDDASLALKNYGSELFAARQQLELVGEGSRTETEILRDLITEYINAEVNIGRFGNKAEIVKTRIDELNKSMSQTPSGPGGGPPTGTDAGAWWDGNIKGAKQTGEAVKEATNKVELMGYSVRRLSSFALRAFTAFPIAIAGVLSSLNQIGKEAEKLGRQDVVNAITDMQRGLETSKQVILDIPIAGKSALDWAKEFATTISLSVKSLAAVLLLMRIRSAEEALAKAKGEIPSALLAQGVRGKPGTSEQIAAAQREYDAAIAAGKAGGAELVTGEPSVNVLRAAHAKLLAANRVQNLKNYEQIRNDAIKSIDDLKSVMSPKLKAIQQEYADLKSQPGLSPEGLQAATVAFDKLTKELSIPAPIVAKLSAELERLNVAFVTSDRGPLAFKKYNEAITDLLKRGQEWAKQQTLMGDRAAEFTSIADNAAAQIKTIQDSITKLSADHAKNILDLKVDFEKSRAKLDAKYQLGIVDDIMKYQEKQTELQIDLAGKKEDIEKESGKKLVDINDNYQKAISNIQERFEKARLKALIDRDARALFEAEQTRDEDLKDANDNRQESVNDEATTHAEKLKEAEDYYTEQTEKAQRAFDNQQMEAAFAYQQQLDQLAQDLNDRLNMEAQTYNDELNLLNSSMAAQNILLDGAMAVLDNVYQIHYNVREQNLYDHIGRMNSMQNAALTPENIYGGTYMSSMVIPTATMDYAIAQQAALDAMRTPVPTGTMEAEKQRVISGGTRRYAEGGYISAPIGTPVQITAHGGEAVIPANIVPGLAAMLSGGMRVTMNIQGDGMLAQILRGVAYDAIVDVLQ